MFPAVAIVMRCRDSGGSGKVWRLKVSPGGGSWCAAGRRRPWHGKVSNEIERVPLKNFFASFLEAAQKAKEESNAELEDALLVTMTVAAKVAFRGTSSKGYSPELWAQMSKRVERFGKDPVGALSSLVDEFTQSAATHIMPAHQTRSGRGGDERSEAGREIDVKCAARRRSLCGRTERPLGLPAEAADRG